jgi:hypothetical protein
VAEAVPPSQGSPMMCCTCLMAVPRSGSTARRYSSSSIGAIRLGRYVRFAYCEERSLTAALKRAAAREMTSASASVRRALRASCDDARGFSLGQRDVAGSKPSAYCIWIGRKNKEEQQTDARSKPHRRHGGGRGSIRTVAFSIMRII